MSNEAQAPIVLRLVGSTPARAATVDGAEPIARVPFDATVVGVNFVARATLTGQDTETRALSLVNKGQGGAGTTAVASLAFPNAVVATAFDEKPLTNSATAADLNVSEGDVLALSSVHSGSTGLADPGGIVIVTLARRPSAS